MEIKDHFIVAVIFISSFRLLPLLNAGSGSVKRQDDPPGFQTSISPVNFTDLPSCVRSNIRGNPTQEKRTVNRPSRFSSILFMHLLELKNGMVMVSFLVGSSLMTFILPGHYKFTALRR